MNRAFLKLIITLSAAGFLTSQAAANVAEGKKTYDTLCTGCHGTGALNAPILGEADQWKDRMARGVDSLEKNAINGFKMMPAKGGNPTLSDQQVKDAVAYMVAALDLSPAATSENKAAPAAPAAPAAAPASAAPAAATAAVKPNAANTFNRLLKGGKDEWNPDPAVDGIHDPDHEESYYLQSPKEAFAGMPESRYGNHIDWVEALATNAINPRFDRLDPNKQPFVLDLNIVREVKGSMPNVVYPHKQHTEWLDCSNCHPAIFTPKKGANQISMASIIMGQQCGVCHGKVAFPISECRRCHSQKKEVAKQ